MKTLLGLAVAALMVSSSAHATTIDLGFFSVNPQGTFLYTAPGDSSLSPTFINLTPYIGDTITITDEGGLCLYTGPNCTVYPASGSYLGGVFDFSTTLLGPNNINRLPGAVLYPNLPDVDTPNLNSELNNMDTTTIYDFDLGLPTTTLTVVAPYLVVGTLDSEFSDNSLGSSPEFGVDITVMTTPEPSTSVLLLSGLAALWISRRKRAAIL